MPARTRRLVGRAVLPIGAALALIGALILGVGVASADPPGNNGTVKIHEGATEDEPIVANEPHVCTFHLHFFYGDDVQSGDWWIVAWPPTAEDEDGDPVLEGTYDATSGEARVPAEGVFELPDGHYKLFWEGATNPGGHVNIKHKVFWVACEEEPSPSESVAPSEEESASPSPSESVLPSEEESTEPTTSPTGGTLPGTPAPTGGTLPSTSLPAPGIDPGMIGTLMLLAGSALSAIGYLERRR